MGKIVPSTPLASIVSVQDIQAFYLDNPIPPSSVEALFPLEQSDSKTWKTISNESLLQNEAADPISLNAKVPVSGRAGFKEIIGEMASFGKGREMTADDLEKFAELKRKFSQLGNAAVAQQLVDFYGNDLRFVRQAMNAEMSYLGHALLSNACNIDFVASNSPYMQGITAMDYGLAAWQKNNTAASWATASTEILTDIASAIATAKSYGKILRKIKINKTWFNYVRNNTQIQKYCATLVQNLYNTQSAPTLVAINTMMAGYFDADIQFEVIDEQITRATRADEKTVLNPFADAVAVFTTETKVGHFAWNPIYIDDVTRETYESFFLVGNYKQVDPSYSKIYAKGRGFPVVDTYADNFYLKINAVAW